MWVSLAVAMLAFAILRSTRTGETDGWTVFWIVAVVIWVAVWAPIELFANRSLERAALVGIEPRRLIALFRTGQLVQSDGQATAIYKGWIAIGSEDIVVTAKRGRRIILSRHRTELDSARSESIPGSYGVLVLTFSDGSRFEAIPVESGIHSVGLSPARVEEIAADVSRIVQV